MWAELLFGLFMLVVFLVFLFPRKVSTPATSQASVTITPNVPLNRLAWVGTHDSTSYQFLDVPLPGLVGSISSDKLSTLQKWCNVCQRVLGAWSFTQEHDVYNQLKMGVRALDLRVASSGKGQLVFAHTFANEYVSEVVAQIQRFLIEDPQAFILISSKADFANESTMDAAAEKAYLDLMESTFGNTLLPVTSKVPTLQDALRQGHRVLFSYPARTSRPWIWPASTFVGGWFSESSVESAYEKYASQVRSLTPSDNTFTQVYLAVTPDATTIKNAYMAWFNPFSPLWKQGNGSVIESGKFTQKDWLCKMAAQTNGKLASINVWWIDAPQPRLLQAFQQGAFAADVFCDNK